MIPDFEVRRLRRVTEDPEQLDLLIFRRASGYPLQYLEGSVDFGSLTLAVDERVLIPRPETEFLADLLVRTVAPPKVVVDLCTGAGPLALFLARAWPAARVIGTDLSELALEVARGNGTGVEWLKGDLFKALPESLRGSIDLLVANPPYVSESEWDLLPMDVRHEPRSALVAGPGGTEVIEEILRSLETWLAAGGEAFIEIGETQGSLRDRYPVAVIRDQYGRDRFLHWKN